MRRIFDLFFCRKVCILGLFAFNRTIFCYLSNRTDVLFPELPQKSRWKKVESVFDHYKIHGTLFTVSDEFLYPLPKNQMYKVRIGPGRFYFPNRRTMQSLVDSLTSNGSVGSILRDFETVIPLARDLTGTVQKPFDSIRVSM